MKVRDEKLEQIITSMNNNEAHVFLIEELADIKKQYRLEREEDRWVEVRNGRTKKMLIKDVVANTHDAVCEIKQDMQILRDFKGFFSFMKKYKGWYVVGLVLMVLASALGLDAMLTVIKSHLP